MRLLASRRPWTVMAISLAAGVSIPTTASAAGFDAGIAGRMIEPTSSKAPASTTASPPAEDTTSAPAGETEPDPTASQPTSSKAPGSNMPDATSAPATTTASGTEPDDDFQTAAVQPDEEDVSLSDERSGGSARGKPFNRHGVGARGGIVIIPTWILSRWVDAHTNALCRGESLGDFAASRGLLKTDGCNFYVGGEYTYRQSRILDIVAAMGYQRAVLPKGYWLDEFSGAVGGATTGNPLSGADYTEVNLHLMTIEADFIARAPIVVRENVEFGLGGGAGVGLGIVFGDVYQTPIGSNPRGFTPGGGETTSSCQVLEDLADLRRCTPRYDPEEDDDGTPPELSELQTSTGQDPSRPYATCTEDECSSRDLRLFGYRNKNEDIPPVIPVVNLILSARVIIKDTFAITLNGGFNTGFYFGGALTYFFGKEFQKVRGDGDTEDGRASAGPGR